VASSGWCRIGCRLTLKLLRSIRTEDLCTGSSSILLSIAWLAATPPGTAPDEEAHYIVRQLLSVTGVGGAAVQITGRSIVARRNSIGIDGPWLFPSAAGAWSPPAVLAASDTSCDLGVPHPRSVCREICRPGPPIQRFSWH